MQETMNINLISLNTTSITNTTSPTTTESHPNITAYTSTLTLSDHQNHLTIGTIQSQLLYKSAMETTDSWTMWEECQAYDAAHLGSKLDKVWNYLSNECFLHDRQVLIDQAEWVLHIQSAHVEPEYRGQRLSLWAVNQLIEDIGVGEGCVVLLQAGVIGPGVSCSKVDGEGAVNAANAGERIARHWRRMGFSEWSYTDDAWLCLSTVPGERPEIEKVLSKGSR